MFEIYQYLPCSKLHICGNGSKYRYSTIILFDTIWLKLEILPKSQVEPLLANKCISVPGKASFLNLILRTSKHITFFNFLILLSNLNSNTMQIHSLFPFQVSEVRFYPGTLTQNRKLVLTFLPYQNKAVLRQRQTDHSLKVVICLEFRKKPNVSKITSLTLHLFVGHQAI